MSQNNYADAANVHGSAMENFDLINDIAADAQDPDPAAGRRRPGPWREGLVSRGVVRS